MRLAAIDRRHNALADVDMKLRDALALYDTAMTQAAQYKPAQPSSASHIAPVSPQQYAPQAMQQQVCA